MEFVEAPAHVVRSIIAHNFLSSELEHPVNSKLGDVILHDHQITAVQFVQRALEEFGGALISDDVGLGKTYVALALAARNRGKTIVVAPAVLREMWRSASQRTGIAVDFVSFESLSRSKFRGAYHFAIVDEAHHVRNPATERYANLIQLTHGARVVLLSATPIHNKHRDLQSLLAIFLGARTLNDEELARCMVRRQIAPGHIGIPTILPTTDILLPADDNFLNRILTIPPPVPPRECGEARTLTTLGLVRQWTSSDAALRGALRRRLAKSVSLMHALQAGRYPSGPELRSWVSDESTVQLAFPEIMAQEIDNSLAEVNTNVLLHAVEEHGDALRELLCSIPDRDSYRVSELRRIRSLHHKIVAFSQYSDTVEHLFRALQSDGGVAMLTALGGRIASGPVNRNDVINQLYSDSPINRVNLLITTDLLSEGVNLQAADAVVHLDLPWTPARLQQRVGRVARMGSDHEQITVYRILPPASAEAVVKAEKILRAKITITNEVNGTVNNVERTRAVLRSWLGDVTNTPHPVVAAVRSDTSGFVASLHESSQHAYGSALISDLDYIPVFGGQLHVDQRRLDAAKRKLAEWASSRAARCRAAPSPIATARKSILRRIDSIAGKAPIHLRHSIMPHVMQARRAATAQAGAATERKFAALASRTDIPDAEWLLAVTRAIGASSPLSSTVHFVDNSAAPLIPALLIFQPDSS